MNKNNLHDIEWVQYGNFSFVLCVVVVVLDLISVIKFLRIDSANGLNAA